MQFEKEAAVSALLYISERVRLATYHRIAKDLSQNNFPISRIVSFGSRFGKVI